MYHAMATQFYQSFLSIFHNIISPIESTDTMKSLQCVGVISVRLKGPKIDQTTDPLMSMYLDAPGRSVR